MKLEDLTINFLKAIYSQVNTNGTFKLWAKTYIRRTYNLDVFATDCVFNAIND